MKNEALFAGGGGGRGLSSLIPKVPGQLSLIPKTTRVVIPKTTYFWNLTIGGNFKV